MIRRQSVSLRVVALVVLGAGTVVSGALGVSGLGMVGAVSDVKPWDIPGQMQRIDATNAALRLFVIGGVVMLAAVMLASLVLLVDLTAAYGRQDPTSNVQGVPTTLPRTVTRSTSEQIDAMVGRRAG